MHLIAAFFALIFSFCQAQSVHHSETFIPPETAAAMAQLQPGSHTDFAPTRQQLAHAQFSNQLSSRYAEGAWSISPQRMNASFDAR